MWLWVRYHGREHFAKLDTIHYPPVPPAPTEAAATAAAGGLHTRVSAHVDDSLFTLLAHDHSMGAGGAQGLQMLVTKGYIMYSIV